MLYWQAVLLSTKIDRKHAMGYSAPIINAFTKVLLLPGDVVCDAFGVRKADNRDLLRMLINSFAWAFIGALFVGLLI